MMKRTGLVLLGVLHSALLWGAAEGSLSTPSFWYVLRRIANPKQMVLSEGGTHNSVHFSCENKGKFSHGFLNPGKDHDDLEIVIPVEEDNAILLSVAKHRFALFQAQSQRLVVRKYDKGDTDRYVDSLLTVEGLPAFLAGELPVVLEILHGGKFVCKYNRAGVSKSSSRIKSSSVEIHMPPEASHGRLQTVHSHSVGCLCAGCASPLPPVPSYPAPTSQTVQPPMYKPLPIPPSLTTPELYARNPFASSHQN